VSTTPEIPGYSFSEQLLDHELAGVWRGASVTGMEVVALVLSEAGAADPQVRDRLAQASRNAALQPGRTDAPLWAANLTATLPYAITQLVPGYSGAERLLDPLDGVFGNDQGAINEVRRRLDASAPPAVPTYAQAGLPTYTDHPRDSGRTFPAPGGQPGTSAGAGLPVVAAPKGGKYWAVMLAVPLFGFLVTYQIGAAVNSASAEPEPSSPKQPVPDAVQPEPLPTKVLLPGIPKSGPAPPRTGIPPVSLVGATPRSVAGTETFDKLGLPFAVHAPNDVWGQVILEESSFSIYRRLLDGEPGAATVDVWIAAHPCKDLAGCLAQRAEFDARWTKRTHAVRPATARDAQTWFTETEATAGTKYQLTMTRAFLSPSTRSWWLVGVKATATPGTIRTAQGVVNDIRTQTS